MIVENKNDLNYQSELTNDLEPVSKSKHTNDLEPVSKSKHTNDLEPVNKDNIIIEEIKERILKNIKVTIHQIKN